MNFYNDLQNKVVLITGSSRGIGSACARMFSECGCKIAIHYQGNESAARQVGQSIKTESHIFKADLSTESECNTLISEVADQFGGIDILVLNHGVWEQANIHTITAAEVNRTIDLNLKSMFYLIREAIPHFSEEKGGSIVIISSTAGQRGEAHYSPYAASKGGIISLTKSFAVELAPKKIRVNSVAPGWVMTDMSKNVLSGKYLEEVTASIPLKRIAEAEDIAPSVVFLSSDYARHITGEILNINGGSVLCG